MFVSVQDTFLVMEGQVPGEDGGGALPSLGGRRDSPSSKISQLREGRHSLP